VNVVRVGALGIMVRETGPRESPSRQPFCSGCLEPLFLLSFWYFLRAVREPPSKGLAPRLGIRIGAREVDASSEPLQFLARLVALSCLLIQDICVFVRINLWRRGLLYVVQCLLELRAFRGHARQCESLPSFDDSTPPPPSPLTQGGGWSSRTDTRPTTAHALRRKARRCIVCVLVVCSRRGAPLLAPPRPVHQPPVLRRK